MAAGGCVIESANVIKVKLLSHVQLFASPWIVVCQAPLSMGFSRQEHWSGLLFPSPGNLPDPGIEPGSLSLQAYSLPSEPPEKPSVIKLVYNETQSLLEVRFLAVLVHLVSSGFCFCFACSLLSYL